MVEVGLHDVPEQVGYPIEPEFIRLDIYRLLSCFGGSKLIRESAQGDSKWEIDFWLDLARDLERSEISRLLVSIAASSRNYMDQGVPPTNVPDLPPDEVGVLLVDRDEDVTPDPLSFREACNKVIHATKITFEANQDRDFKTSYLLPIVYLYGEKQGTNWKATVDVRKFLFWANRNF